MTCWQKIDLVSLNYTSLTLESQYISGVIETKRILNCSNGDEALAVQITECSQQPTKGQVEIIFQGSWTKSLFDLEIFDKLVLWGKGVIVESDSNDLKGSKLCIVIKNQDCALKKYTASSGLCERLVFSATQGRFIEDTLPELVPPHTEIANIYEKLQKREFRFLDSIEPETTVNIIAMIVAVKPVEMTRGPDHKFGLSLADPSCRDFLSVNLFGPFNLLQDLGNVGDVIIFRNLKVQEFNGRPQGKNWGDTSWIVFTGGPVAVKPRSIFGLEHRSMDNLQREIVVLLMEWWAWRRKNVSDWTMGRPKPLLTTEQITTANKYFEYIAEVVQVHQGLERVTLTVTDYTANPNFRELPGATVENRPSQVTCTLWDQNAIVGERLNSGDIILFTNVRSKNGNDGVLELSLHGDREKKDKVDIIKLSHNIPEVENLLRRRQIYQRQLEKNLFPSDELAEASDWTMGRSKPLLTTEQITTANKYFEYIAEVVQVHQGLERVTLTVTDYTANPNFRELPGVTAENRPSQVTCTLWDQNVIVGEKLSSGDIVLFTNVRSKNSNDGVLELSLHGDRERKDKVDIIKLSHNIPEVENLLRRRQIYQRQLERSLLPSEEFTEITGIEYCAISVTPIADVRNHPEPINKFRIRGRMVDIIPPEIEKLTRFYCKDCHRSFEPSPQIRVLCQCSTITNHIYRFSMLLQDENGDTLPVIVDGKEGNEFLKLPSVNLYLDENTRSSLQNKLNRLHWFGKVKLEQGVYEGSPWFDCCVMSYEVIGDGGGMIRRWKLFNTVLL